MITLAKCAYGDADLGPDCCFVDDGESVLAIRCEVFDWDGCPFEMEVEGCGTCAHAGAMTLSCDEERMVDCELNEMQMYAPYATECKHWERALG